MAIKKTLPTKCPSCGGNTQVHSLHCNDCGTTITGAYDIPPIMQLSAEEQTFINNFIKCSGSLKPFKAWPMCSTHEPHNQQLCFSFLKHKIVRALNLLGFYSRSYFVNDPFQLHLAILPYWSTSNN